MMNDVMLISNFETLRRQKALSEMRDISLNAVARETGLSANTIHRAATGAGNLTLSTMETLCKYFNLQSLNELVEYRADN